MTDALHLGVSAEFLEAIGLDLANTFYADIVLLTDLAKGHSVAVRLADAKAQLDDLKLTLQQRGLRGSVHTYEPLAVTMRCVIAAAARASTSILRSCTLVGRSTLARGADLARTLVI